jgi:hypothetical protein
MLSFINFITFFFILLIIYQVFLAFFEGMYVLEGMENTYKPYDMNNPANAMILAQQNAGNISFLKKQIDELLGLNKEVKDISGNVVILQEQMVKLLTAQQQYATQLTGGSAPNITGVLPEESK